MKQFIFAAALLGATATTALAQKGYFPPPPTEAQSLAGKQKMIAKTAELETLLKSHNMAKAEAATLQLENMMKDRVGQTRYMAEDTEGTQKDALLTRMVMMEGRVRSFQHLRSNVAANGQQLVTEARTFTGDY